MSKERLEEIKEAYRLSHKEIGAYVNSEGIEYLIQQAEKVQELEEENEQLKAELNKMEIVRKCRGNLEEQTIKLNQRYKQALKDTVKFNNIHIAQNALKEEPQ